MQIHQLFLLPQHFSFSSFHSLLHLPHSFLFSSLHSFPHCHPSLLLLLPFLYLLP
ncbi:unnamed protein product [Meloidogyne enterolobii]|uniref:Uncharacterized protein n=1 Tax=Meloidogyne enterolobii TaxID=390850 RepID=A0ACB0YCL0_MELEN